MKLTPIAAMCLNSFYQAATIIIITYSCAVDPVTLRFEEAFYSITQPNNSVEICMVTEGILDETATVNLQILSGFLILFTDSLCILDDIHAMNMSHTLLPPGKYGIWLTVFTAKKSIVFPQKKNC